MGKFVVPQFHGQETVAEIGDKIEGVLKACGAIRIRYNRAGACTAFAVPDPEDYSETSTFARVSQALIKLHPNCVALSYRYSGDWIRRCKACGYKDYKAAHSSLHCDECPQQFAYA